MAKSLSMHDPLPAVQSDECEIVVIDNENTIEELQSAVERIRCVVVVLSLVRRLCSCADRRKDRRGMLTRVVLSRARRSNPFQRVEARV